MISYHYRTLNDPSATVRQLIDEVAIAVIARSGSKIALVRCAPDSHHRRGRDMDRHRGSA